jgi:diguanylate cyclase (GGDEF)-like protein/PAS domain S-box-containing protein
MSQPDPPLKYTPLQFAGTARLITICAGISVLLFVASSLMLWSIISDPSLLLYIELGKALVFAAILAALLLRCLRIKGHAASLREDLLLHHLIGLPAMGMAIVSTERQRVARCNDRLGEILGYSVDALLAKGWSELIHPEDAALDHADLERLLRGDSDGYCVEMRFVRNDGSTVIASSSASCLRSPSGEAEWLVYSLQDLSGLKENESRIVRLTRLYAALSHCNQAIVHSNGPEELYPKVCETAVLFGGMKMAWIGMADEDGRVRPVSAFGDGLDYLSALTVTTPVDDPSGQGPVGRAIRDNVPVWNQDFLQDPLALPWRAQAERFGWRSVAALPLHRDGAVIGAFALYSGEKDAFDETAQNLLIEMGCDIDYALDNFQREEIKRQMSKALRESEDRFRDLFQNAPLPYHSLDIEGNILEVNQRWLSILGYRRKDVIGRFFEDLVASESLTQYRISFAHFKERGSIEENYLELICKDGSRRQWVANGRIARDSEGNFLRTHCIFTDFTERKQIEGQLQLAGKVFEQSGEGIIVVDASYRIVMVNKAFTEITGYAAHEAIGQNPRMLGSGRHGTDFYMQMWDAIEKQGRWQGEVWNRKKSGDPYPEWLSISRVVDPEGKLTHYIGIFSDLTEHKAAQAHIHRLAHFDVLTGLPNRVLLGERSRLALSMAQRDLEPLALMFIDLDHFKNINDSLGHRIGDNLLVQFSRRMNDIVREQDTFSRLGGDEFILLLPSTNVKGAGQLAKKLLDAAQTPYLIDGHELSITCSIGIAMYPKDGRDFDSLSQSADMAMYRAKQIGRNNYSFFTADMQTHSVQTLEMENALRRALERDQLSLHYRRFRSPTATSSA